MDQNINWYEALGVAEPEESQETSNTAGEEEELTPEADEAAESGADTAPQEEQGAGPEDAAPEEEAQGAPEGEKGQSREENSKYAAARRKAEKERDEEIARLKAEQEAALQKAREDARNEVFRAFADAGMVDPYTKKPITNLQEFEAYKKADAQAKADKFKRTHRLTDEQYRELVEGLPEVQTARAQSAEAQRVLEKQTRAAQMEQIEREIAEVGTMNPSIRSAEDLSKDPAYARMLELINKGLSIPDAYRLTHFDELRGAAAQGAAQQAAINQAGKEHMRAIRQRGAGGQIKSVPPETLEMYRALNPDMTDEEISKHYNKQHK